MSLTGRNYILTLNNPEIDSRDWLKGLYEFVKAAYVVGQLEKGEVEGTLHIQAYVNFKQSVRPSCLKKYDNRMACFLVKVDNGVRDYCMKEETRLDGPWEFGIRPVRRNNKTDWDDIKQLAKDGMFDKIPSDILIQHYSNLKMIHKDSLKLVDKDDLRGVWIHGEAGTGKSRYARTLDTQIYPKLCNKWWDGYQGQQTVVMDDFGKDHKVLGHHLKIWSDRYGCILETKGGAIADNYTRFVVTSQYKIEDIWQDEETITALNRRFKIINIKDINNI